MTEVCARCGHTSGGCQRCGRHDDDLGGGINGQDYCHNVEGETCYMIAQRDMFNHADLLSQLRRHPEDRPGGMIYPKPRPIPPALPSQPLTEDDMLWLTALAREAVDTGKRYTLEEVAAKSGIDLDELRAEDDQDWDEK